ncbi:HPP family protein [Devosia neptuniae]|uniref:HPP family protein n=1 Tax=Devosia neptuniae TaxID=191302 RepID=A0ABY6C7Q7_9HYPH|nr:HPP family protein [Devosia neptuniae]UXN68274.1 HPP family protein [Devosia neptuniae]
MSSVIPFIKRFVPGLAPVSLGERLRASIGALIGIVVTGLIAGLALGSSSDIPLLIAPMGASAVLLFAAPTSPLAQPWSIIGGNTIAALIGVTCARYIGNPMLAAGIAVALAISAMMALRCLHPPSGAVALTAVLGGPAIQAAGFGFVVWPVLANSVLLLLAALLFNNLTGRRYPHLAPMPAHPHRTADPLPTGRLGVTQADISAVLAQYDLVLPVATDDLEDILHRAEIRAYDRRSGGVTCADIMSRDVQSVGPKTSLREALRHLREHHIKALPVVDLDSKVIGILTQTDLLDKADWGMSATGSGLGWRLRSISNSDRRLKGKVEDIMSAPVKAARPDTHIAQIVPFMADAGLHHLPVVDENGRLVGMVTQSDVMAAMFAVSLDNAN